MCFFVQTNHTRKELLFLMFKEINLRNHSSLHKLFYSLSGNADLDSFISFISGLLTLVNVFILIVGKTNILASSVYLDIAVLNLESYSLVIKDHTSILNIL